MRQEARSRMQDAGCKKQEAGGRRQAGDSLIELLAALAIISMGLVVLIAALSTASFSVRTSNRLTTATNLAANQLETIKAAPYDAAGAYPLVSTSPGYTITLSSQVIVTRLQQVTVTVAYEGGAVVVSNYKVNR